jgi:ABC-2 type transport system ATP-binding protein
VLENVSKSFRSIDAVQGLSLTLREGTVCGLLGPNGSGKSTTIRMIMNILLPDSGQVRLWGGTPADAVRTRVGYLPEERGLYPRMTVLDHLLFFAELHDIRRHDARQRVEEWLQRFATNEETTPLKWLGRRVQELSKGQQQTIQFIGALLHDPALVIFDEPFSGLDPVHTSHVRSVIRTLTERGTAILLSTHRMEQAERLCDEIYLVNHGKCVLSGSLRAVKASAPSRLVELRMETTPDFLAPDDLIADAEIGPDGSRVRLREGADPQKLLARAQSCGRVLKFEIVEPSLDDLFIEAVGG